MSTLTTVTRYRVSLVREEHSPLYGAPKITQSSQMVDLLRPHFRDLPHEEFVTVFLDAQMQPIGYQVVSMGSLSMSLVHPREVFKAAILSNSAAVIFGHNHPSGSPTPSEEDRVLTERLVEAGELLGIRVLDHVVICDNTPNGSPSYVSFADQGWLTAY